MISAQKIQVAFAALNHLLVVETSIERELKPNEKLLRDNAISVLREFLNSTDKEPAGQAFNLPQAEQAAPPAEPPQAENAPQPNVPTLGGSQ